MPGWPAVLATSALLGGLSVAGCGGADSGDTPPEPTASAAESPSVVTSGTPASGASSRAFFPNGPSKRAVVWAVGDAMANKPGRAVASLIARGRPDVVLYLGDVYENGTMKEFRTNFAPAFGSLGRRTAPTPGNHDWPNRGNGYLSYWQKSRARPTPAFYSFKAGGWDLLSLNSEIGPRKDQMRFIEGRIKTPGTCRLAFWHRPRFSAGMHGDYRPMDEVWRALRGHATLVVSGHDHDMQRMKAQDGLTQYVSGAGGRSHYALNRGYPGMAWGSDKSWGALRIVLTPGSATLDFVSTAGKRLDSSRVSCRR